jgi:hypothetical protein
VKCSATEDGRHRWETVWRVGPEVKERCIRCDEARIRRSSVSATEKTAGKP